MALATTARQIPMVERLEICLSRADYRRDSGANVTLSSIQTFQS
jgi:hypothetical protein